MVKIPEWLDRMSGKDPEDVKEVLDDFITFQIGYAGWKPRAKKKYLEIKDKLLEKVKVI